MRRARFEEPAQAGDARTHDGVAALISHTRFWTHLTSSSHSSPQIGVRGCEAIASHMILQPPGGAVLRTLLLSYNEVGDEGATALAEVISLNRPLTRLGLKNNNINQAGLVTIGHALGSNGNLSHLALFGNHFSHHTGEVFASCVGGQGGTVTMDFKVYKVDEVYMVAESD